MKIIWLLFFCPLALVMSFGDTPTGLHLIERDRRAAAAVAADLRNDPRVRKLMGKLMEEQDERYRQWEREQLLQPRHYAEIYRVSFGKGAKP